jgi:ABC-type uncharacterized transport system fused permease/ATPase subunit
MKKTQVSFSYGIKNCVYQTIEWRYNFLSHLYYPYFCILKAYAINEMANIERIRNVEQQITSTVDEVTNDFKQRIQSIVSQNQLLLSNSKVFLYRKNNLIFSSFSTSTSYISTINSL